MLIKNIYFQYISGDLSFLFLVVKHKEAKLPYLLRREPQNHMIARVYKTTQCFHNVIKLLLCSHCKHVAFCYAVTQGYANEILLTRIPRHDRHIYTFFFTSSPCNRTTSKGITEAHVSEHGAILCL